MKRPTHTLVICLLFILPLFAACGGAGSPAASTPAADTAATTAPDSAATTAPDSAATSAPAAESDGATTDYPTEAINIMAPAAPGGGWDQTARAMQPILNSQTGQNVEVYNVPGAGGTVGLAQFAGDAAGNPHQLMVMGLVMVGAIETNDAPVKLDQVTPIATLTTEWMAVVVPADSEYQTFQQLVDAFKADPTAVSWGGGSAGGTDHILVGLIAKAAEVDPASINYVAHAGGGEALTAILSGAVTVGVSGLSEFRDQVEAGTLRLLAVSSEEPLEGVDAPTIKEQGLDVVLPNWRAIVAPSGITPEQRDAIVAAVEQMHDSEEWRQALEQNGWNDFFQTGDEFNTFLSEESTRIQGVLRDIGLVN
jgi:putative tricarboxylic transport membrane protein